MFSNRKKKAQQDLGEKALLYLDQLFGTALRLTGSRAQAEDLVHDTFVRALRFHERFDPDTNLRAWLFRIMFNLFVNNCRRDRRGREIREGSEKADMLQRVLPEERTAPSSRPEEFFFEKLFSDDVVQALDDLPTDFKLAVLLSDVNGFSYKQISDILGIPVGTVMSRLHRGRRLLRAALHEFAVQEGYIRPEGGEAGMEPTNLEEYRRKRAGQEVS